MSDTTRLPGPFEHRWSWQLKGTCRTVDSSVFFHPTNERGAAAKHREQVAKSVCARCPVLAQCRQYAMDVREPYGVWGGLTEDERRELLARRRRRQSPAAA
ncbi:WhiB family transcriptional regulator [Streptomyces sp. NRRL S-350]|uniref:WhiB family transcriptional regulator n=1 Tax=Streptomyces sp. NRRL S-350 TaxID=1463902 RepID=UPI0004C06816|nr:WhiB family transcriptional regulator [Streptomyces sp. NRRL S-350]